MPIQVKADNALDPNYEPAVENQETPVENTPVVETPVVETPVAEPATSAAPTEFEGKWKELFGDATPDVVKSKFSQFDAINGEYEKVKATPAIAPYKTDAAKQIDEWMAKGIPLKTIVKFQDIKPETLTEEQAIKLREEIQNPAWKTEHIEASYQDKYLFQEEDGIELTSEEKNKKLLKQAALLKDGSEAKAFLSDYIGKQFNPPAPVDTTAENEQKANDLAKSWGGQASSILPKLKEISLSEKYNRMGEKGEQEQVLNFKYAPADNDLKAVVEQSIQAAVAAGLQPTEENLNRISEYATELVWAKHGKSIVKAAVDQQAKDFDDFFKKTVNNPQLAGTVTERKSGEMDYNQRVLEAEKRRGQPAN